MSPEEIGKIFGGAFGWMSATEPPALMTGANPEVAFLVFRGRALNPSTAVMERVEHVVELPIEWLEDLMRQIFPGQISFPAPGGTPGLGSLPPSPRTSPDDRPPA